jgi:Dolichyl-phosphate-mannose-protein mannosyltransferase
MRLTNRGAWVLLIALIVWFAALLRVWNINKESFWADEGWTMILSKGPTLADVTQTMASDQHPPLYFALMHYWIDLVGNSEIMVRLLSTFWSLIGVAAIYRLGADLFSPGAGAAAALMLALADNDIFLAQDARHYTAMAALASLSTLCYFRYYCRPSRGSGIAWLLSSVALLYTHYLGGFILIVQLLHMLIFGRRAHRLRDMFVRWLAIWLAWLPWAFVFVGQSLVRYTRPIIYQSAMPNTPESFQLIRGDLLGSHFGLTFGLLLLGLLYVFYRDGRARFMWRPVYPTVYLGLWFLLPIIILIVINTRYEILTTRNFLLITPVIMLLIGHGLMNLDRVPRTFILAILVVVGLTTVDAYLLKPPWRQVALDILNYRASGEPVLMDVWTDDFALRYHIGRDLQTDPAALPLISLPEWRERYGRAFEAYLLQYLTDRDSFWLAYWGDSQNPLFDFFTQQGFFRTATQLEKHRETNLIYVYRYDRLRDETAATFGDVLQLKRYHVEQAAPAGKPTLQVSLLWQARKHPELDYSVSVFLLDQAGQLVAQHDSPPLDGRSPTSAWQTGDLRFDHHSLTLPADLPAGRYDVGVKIYWYGDAKPLPVKDSAQPDYFVLQSIVLPG